VAEKNQDIPDAVIKYVQKNYNLPEFFKGSPRFFGTAKGEDYIKSVLSSSEEELFDAIIDFLTNHGYSDLFYDKQYYIYARGDIPIGISVHLDTVFRTPPSEIYIMDETGFIFSFDKDIGLGADDRAGVYILLKIIEAGYKPGIIMTRMEEKYAEGARKLADVLKEIPDFMYIIALDRMGANDAVFYRNDNKEFKKYITETFKFVEATGTSSDISVLCPKWKISGVNLSVGYSWPHKEYEMLSVPIMKKMVTRVKKMLDNPPQEQFVYVEKKYAYTTSYGYGTTQYGGSSCIQSADFWTLAVETRQDLLDLAVSTINDLLKFSVIKKVEITESRSGTGRSLVSFDEKGLKYSGSLSYLSLYSKQFHKYLELEIGYKQALALEDRMIRIDWALDHYRKFADVISRYLKGETVNVLNVPDETKKTTEKKESTLKAITETKETTSPFEEKNATRASLQLIYVLEHLPFVKDVVMIERTNKTGYVNVQLAGTAKIIIPLFSLHLVKEFNDGLLKVTDAKNAGYIVEWTKIVSDWLDKNPGFVGKLRKALEKEKQPSTEKKMPVTETTTEPTAKKSFGELYPGKSGQSVINELERIINILYTVPFIMQIRFRVDSINGNAFGFGSLTFKTDQGAIISETFKAASKDGIFKQTFLTRTSQTFATIETILKDMERLDDLGKLPGFMDVLLKRVQKQVPGKHSIEGNVYTIDKEKIEKKSFPKNALNEKDFKDLFKEQQKAILGIAVELLNTINNLSFVKSVQIRENENGTGYAVLYIKKKKETSPIFFNKSDDLFFSAKLRKEIPEKERADYILKWMITMEQYLENYKGFANVLANQWKKK